MNQIGRPPLVLVCEKYPGLTFSVSEAARMAGISEWAIHSAVQRGSRTGSQRLRFSKYIPRSHAKDPDEIDQWLDAAECAFDRHGKTVVELVNSTENKTEVFGLVFTPDDNFEDVDANLHCIVALILDRNPLRDELFQACREVLPKMR